jgi:hypothetical protein
LATDDARQEIHPPLIAGFPPGNQGFPRRKTFKHIGNFLSRFLRGLPPLLAFVFEVKAWTGRGDGGAIRESTGRDLGLHQRNQKDFRKERRKAYGLRLILWENRCLVVSRSATLPPRPGGAWKQSDSLCF